MHYCNVSPETWILLYKWGWELSYPKYVNKIIQRYFQLTKGKC